MKEKNKILYFIITILIIGIIVFGIYIFANKDSKKSESKNQSADGAIELVGDPIQDLNSIEGGVSIEETWQTNN